MREHGHTLVCGTNDAINVGHLGSYPDRHGAFKSATLCLPLLPRERNACAILRLISLALNLRQTWRLDRDGDFICNKIATDAPDLSWPLHLPGQQRQGRFQAVTFPVLRNLTGCVRFLRSLNPAVKICAD